MSGINDGQRVNAANSNAAWLAKNGDDTTVGKLGLNNPDTASGTSITNLQREQNAIWSFLGGIINQVKTYLPTWSNNNGFTSTDSVKDRVDSISGKFNSTSGHGHTGAAGDGPAISSSSLANVVLRGFQVRGVDISSPSGSSINVSTQMTGKSVSSGQTVKGVVVSSPYNEVVIKRLTGSESDTHIEDSSGNVVFGRLTHSAGVWTLSFFTDVSGTETAYTMTAGDTSAGIKWWYIELFNPITDAPVYPEHIFIPSDNYTQDILDASITQRGLVSTGAQTFEGEKTLEKALVPKVLASAPSNPPSNYFKLYPKADGFYSLNSSGVETKIGSGQGRVNFITTSDAEGGTTGWSTYADVAGSRPVDGTGGTANVTWTTTTSTPLNGSNSFLFTKDAVNRQGQGVSFAFSIPLEFRAKALSVEVPYIVASGTFAAGTSSADSDLIVYFYDVTNSKLVEASSLKLLSNSTTISDMLKAQVQFDSNCTSARLIIHCATTSASAYTVEFDDVYVGPSNYSYGTPVTDWQSYTPTFQGFGTPTSVECFWRRVGSDVEISATFTSGTSTAVEARVGLPSGLTSQGSPRIVNIQVAGSGGFSATGANQYIPLIEASVTYLTMGIQSAGAAALTKISSTSSFVASGQRLSLSARVPVSGFSSSVQTSDQTDTRVVAVEANSNAAQVITANTTNVTFSTTTRDTHGAWNGTVFTAPVSGDYAVYGILYGSSSSNNVLLYVDGTLRSIIGGEAGSSVIYHKFSGQTFLNAGQQLSIRLGVGVTLVNSSTAHRISISRVSGPNQISANELVAASYTGLVSATVSTTAPFRWDTKDFDTHSCVTTGASWKFTAPVSGRYMISASALLNTGGPAAVLIYKNGADANAVLSSVGSTTWSGGSQILQLNAGDYVDVRTGSALTAASGPQGRISIQRIGF